MAGHVPGCTFNFHLSKLLFYFESIVLYVGNKLAENSNLCISCATMKVNYMHSLQDACNDVATV